MENYLSIETFKPRADNVLVRPEKAPAVSSLIATPDTVKRRTIDPMYAEVVAVPERVQSFRRSCSKCLRAYDRYADELRVGDRVLLDSDTCGDAVLLDGVEHRIVRVAEIAGVVEA